MVRYKDVPYFPRENLLLFILSTYSWRSTSRSKSLALALGDDSTQLNVNPKLLLSYEEKVKAVKEYSKKHGKKEDAYNDMTKFKEVSNLLLNQKIALFEMDMEQEAKKEAVISDVTMKGAGYWKVRKVLKFLKVSEIVILYGLI